MRDCANTKMRDVLPDLLHDRLAAATRAEVQAHVDACDACRSELELLRLVRAAVTAPRVDASRIAAAIPRYRMRSFWHRPLESAQLRAAAAIVLIVGGGTVFALVARRPRVPEVPPTVSGRSIVQAPPSTAATAGTTAGVVTSPTGPVVSGELAVGETFQDLTESELRALLDDLANLQAVTPAEDDVILPAFGRSGT
jgi:putative zinc finger protein